MAQQRLPDKLEIRYGLLASSEEDTSFRADDDNIYTQIGRDFGAFRLLYEDNSSGANKGIGVLSTLVTNHNLIQSFMR